MDNDEADINEFLANIFGEGYNFGHQSYPGNRARYSNEETGKPKKKARGEDQIVDYKVSLEDCYMGKETILELEKDIVCSSCNGCVAIFILFRFAYVNWYP